MANKSMLPYGITPKQMEIIKVMIDIRYPSNKAMAHAIGLSVGTFKEYLHRLYRKLPIECTHKNLVLWVIVHRVELQIVDEVYQQLGCQTIEDKC